MATKKPVKKTSIEDFTAAELYEIAKKKEREEQKKLIEANREKIRELRAKKRSLIRQYEKELRELDAEIEMLGGKIVATPKASRGSVTDAVIAILEKNGETSSKDLKAELRRQGYATNNLLQTLGYLKKKGRIESPSRAIYRLVA